MRKIAVITLKNCKFHPEILDIVVGAAHFINSLLYTTLIHTNYCMHSQGGKLKRIREREEKNEIEMVMIFPIN